MRDHAPKENVGGTKIDRHHRYSHPVIAVMKRVYTTPWIGPVVTFQHKEHIDVSDSVCKLRWRIAATAMTFENDAGDQDQGGLASAAVPQADQCRKCRTRSAPGLHNTTGWPLSPYRHDSCCVSVKPASEFQTQLDVRDCRHRGIRKTSGHCMGAAIGQEVHSVKHKLS
jgi:hypothetical protein